MAEIQRKCAEKQLKIRTGNWFLPGLMIVLLLLGAAAVTCLHFGIQDQKRAARLLDEAKQDAKKAKRYNTAMMIITIISMLVAVAAWLLPNILGGAS